MKIIKHTDEEFAKFFDVKVREVFKETFSYNIMDVRTPVEAEQAKRLKEGLLSNDRLNLGIYDDQGNLAGWSFSSQFRIYSLYMHNSAILPEFRRKGYYSALVKETLHQAEALGYQVIFSNHVLSNNDVIIAKLKLGFKIMGVETYDDYGSTVKLVYHINEERRRAFDMRAGLTKPDESLKKLFRI